MSTPHGAGIQPGAGRFKLDLFSFSPHDGRVREISQPFAWLLGLTTGEPPGRLLTELVHPEDRDLLTAQLSELARVGRELLIECRFAQANDEWLHLSWLAWRSPRGDVWQAAGADTADLVALLDERRQLHARLDLAIGQATAAMWELDVPRARLEWEPQAAEILGADPSALPNDAAALAAAVHPRDREIVHVALGRLVTEGTMEVALRVGEAAAVRHLSLRGRILDRDACGRPLRGVGLLLDVSTEKAMEEQLLRMTVSDPLTGTANRRAFDQALRGEWRRCARAGTPLAIIMADIDHFKQVNDRFGHLVGDEALVAVARALGRIIHREGDLVSRYGGEEFAVILPGADSAGARAVGERMAEAVRSLRLRQAPDWELTLSVGTACWRPGRDGLKPAHLHARADEALYEAKRSGRRRIVTYEESLASRDALRAEIARGIEHDEFELHYQPLIDVTTGRVDSFEALVRWNRPGHGLASPAVFIPVAESSSLICDLDRWVLRAAARQLSRWSADGQPALTVAVNVSARHAADPEIVRNVEAALSGAEIRPEQLELELTETALSGERSRGLQLPAVRALGVGVAIDDFGTGFTSISEIARLPADRLKIDRSFVASADARERNLIKLMIEAAHAFGLAVVAEGIETAEVLDELRALGCDLAQGYLLARPMPADQVPAWLAQHRAVTQRSFPAAA